MEALQRCNRSMKDHIEAQPLEGYVRSRLDAPELAAVEEHLLVCRECRRRLEDEERLIGAVREALRRSVER